uniref:Uncharacterized protein n=1 Tax=Macrostomum lignano TaxID=282301 RepID=A0A1I8JB36_9PLAT
MDYAESLKIGGNFYPVDIGNGLRLSPGTQSFVHVKVKQTVYQRDCLAATPELLDLYISGRQWRVKYTTDLCTYLGRHDTYKELDAFDPRDWHLTHLTCLMPAGREAAYQTRESSKPRCDPLCTQSRFTVARSEAKRNSTANSALDFLSALRV